MPGKFDVFISYNHKDQIAVRKIVKRLKEHRINVWFDEEINPGQSWQSQLEMLLEEIPSVAIIIGSEIGKWHSFEMRVVIDESINRGIPVIPVLIKGNEPDIKLPIFLRQFMWVDCRDGISKENLARIIQGITGKRLKQMKRVNYVSPKTLDLSIKSSLKKRGAKIPYRIVGDEAAGYEHYPLRIALDGPRQVLDSITEVEYKLHKAFKRPRRLTSDRVNKFAIEIWAYGGFEMSAIVHFDNGALARLQYEVVLELPDDDGTNYVVDKSKIGESIFEGCDLPG
ncbi:TIR domain-containing protein [Foetidibacter luteolus]|uniref:TIR domain-containing protein n=1 Tax=Foetidibacter luteolus TaxID=2608880 RepID=UPI001A98DD92|nr:TIR domain-containing protein [Foetidibacter luteolus]